MEKSEAKALALELMKKHGLLPEWEFAFSYAKRRFGSCSYRTKTIHLSLELTELNDIEPVRNTILHEIAHALTPKNRHGIMWKKKALEIGCDGKRCYDHHEVATPPPQYKAVCSTCGHAYERHTKVHGERSCSHCSRTFNRDFLLIFVKQY